MKYTYAAMLLLGFITFSCAENTKETKSPESQKDFKTSFNKPPNLKLNGDAKWEANPETTQGIQAMQQHLIAFKEKGSKDFSALKSMLETEFTYVFEKCTMKGVSHDQLHNFLYPLAALFENLDKDTKIAQKAVQELEEYLPIYFQYFQ